MKTDDVARIALAWARTPGVSARRFWRVHAKAGGWRQILESRPEDLLPEAGSEEAARGLTRPWETDVSEEVDAAARAEACVLTPFAGPYPRLLREVPDAPLLLYARGRTERLELPQVAIVGARASTPYGREVASELAHDLSASGVCVVSGMARGIDAAAHEAALPGPGGTIGVLGSGIDVAYPAENRELHARVGTQGLLLSEFAPGDEPRSEHFPVRNRIIAGMSAGVVVVEAAERSGSLITARLAADFGREVFAIPGSIHSASSRGCHALLREGAVLARSAEDVLAEIFPAIGVAGGSPDPARELAGDAARIWEHVHGAGGCTADEIADALELPAAQVMVLLFELEARGLLKQASGSLYTAAR